MNIFKIELKNLGKKEDIHDIFYKVLFYPECPYGKNLNAFWDCITEINEPMDIRIYDFLSLNDEKRIYIKQYLLLLIEYAEDPKWSKGHEDIKITFYENGERIANPLD